VRTGAISSPAATWANFGGRRRCGPAPCRDSGGRLPLAQSLENAGLRGNSRPRSAPTSAARLMRSEVGLPPPPGDRSFSLLFISANAPTPSTQSILNDMHPILSVLAPERIATEALPFDVLLRFAERASLFGRLWKLDNFIVAVTRARSHACITSVCPARRLRRWPGCFHKARAHPWVRLRAIDFRKWIEAPTLPLDAGRWPEVVTIRSRRATMSQDSGPLIII
jgi:hypothetical protein